MEGGLKMIYFAQQGKSGPIKIGFTDNDVRTRLYQLRTSSPTQINLIGTIHGDKEKESSIHEYFKEFHIKNEWFQPTTEIFNYIFARVAEIAIEPLKTREAKITFDLKIYVHGIERAIISQVLADFKGNKTKTAKYLNLTRPTLHDKINRLDI